MLLTFEIVLRERHILLQRDAKILMRNSIYAFTSYSGGVIHVIHKLIVPLGEGCQTHFEGFH